MVFQKAMFLNEIDIALAILDCRTNFEISEMEKKLNPKLSNDKKQEWLKEVYENLYKANIAKFSQNENLKRLLLNTGDSLIVFCSKHAKLYGNGYDYHSWQSDYPAVWSGHNLLGMVLMQVRTTLKNMN
jgi:ribA/ribD-fused uncharacterized protein